MVYGLFLFVYGVRACVLFLFHVCVLCVMRFFYDAACFCVVCVCVRVCSFMMYVSVCCLRLIEWCCMACLLLCVFV